MQVWLDEEICAVEAGSVGDAIAAGAALAQNRARFIVEVLVDGQPLEDGEIDSGGQADAHADEVRMVSADLVELVCSMLQDADAALLESETAKREAAELLQADRSDEAMQRLGTVLGIWLDIHEGMQMAVEAADLDLDALIVDEVPAPLVIDRLNEHLQSIRAALEASDPIGLADALLYEQADIVGSWRQLLMQLQGQVREDKEQES